MVFSKEKKNFAEPINLGMPPVVLPSSHYLECTASAYYLKNHKEGAPSPAKAKRRLLLVTTEEYYACINILKPHDCTLFRPR